MRFKVKFNPSSQRIPVILKASQKFPVTIKNLQQITAKPDVEFYEGEYQVTPKVESQTVPTAQKFLTNDMTIKAIPFFNVANNSGGNTVYIGSEV